jgi:hypothetical protein
MLATYKATLKGNCLEWSEAAPAGISEKAVAVYVTILGVTAETEQNPQGQQMAAALEQIVALAKQGGVADITDPSAWQRETRQDRDLPGRG